MTDAQPSDGPALLAEFIHATGRTKLGSARVLGVSERCLYNWIGRRNRPDVVSAFAIEDWSGGAVPARSWLTAADESA
jgi:hypothetical protein